MMRRALFVGGILLLAVASALAAQQQTITRQIRSNQSRLDSIRRERADLEDELTTLMARVRSLTGELENIDRQKRVTGRLVNELDRQMVEMNAQVDTVSMTLILAEDAYAETEAILQRRLVEIYKRGTLYTFEALISAASFGDLISRYKYLFLVSQQDRALVGEISNLRDQVGRQRAQLVRIRAAVTENHDERTMELDRFQALERRRQSALRSVQATQRVTETRIDTLALDESRLVDVLAALERARRSAAGADFPASEATITTADLGTLDWPVEGGSVVYDFGTAPGPDNTQITYQGIGISVPAGTEVRAVAAGIVDIAGPFGTYGQTIFLHHGGGIYTGYTNLSFINVRLSQWVEKGAVIGHTGGASSDHGPHLGFQIRQTEGGNPIALDPLNWLKRRR